MNDDHKEHAQDVEFQKLSSEYIYNKLFNARDGEYPRFLLADEVGLGKTVVTQAVIGKLFENRRGRSPCTVLYFCSSQEIGSQNINKLKPRHDVEAVNNKRISMMITDRDVLKKDAVIALTPATSIEVSRSTGKKEERRILYYLLTSMYGITHKKKGYVRELLRCSARDIDDWKDADDEFSYKIQRNIKERLKHEWQSLNMNEFLPDEYKKDRINFKGGVILLSKILLDSGRGKKHARISKKRNKLVGKLRESLVSAMLDVINPKLIVFDEFQRYKEIIHRAEDKNSIEYKLFGKPGRASLLLSATPYKMYARSMDDENPYEDMKETLRFLFGKDKEQLVEDYDRLSREYRRALISMVTTKPPEYIKSSVDKGLNDKKCEIESLLKQVMLRIERRMFFPDERNIAHDVRGSETIWAEPEEIREYLFLAGIAAEKSVSRHSLLEYWKSAPFLLNFMNDHYELIRSIHVKKAFAGALARGLVFTRNIIKRYKALTPRNFKYNRFSEISVKKLQKAPALWIPPQYTYYQCADEPQTQPRDVPRKYLIFSSWVYIPQALSMLLSYEAECFIMKKRSKNYYNKNGRKPLLLFKKGKGGALTSFSIFNIFYPSYWLASRINPLEIARHSSGPVSRAELHARVKEQLTGLLNECGVTVMEQNSETDISLHELLLYCDRKIFKKDYADADDIGQFIVSIGRKMKNRDGGEVLFSSYAADLAKRLRGMSEPVTFNRDNVSILADIAIGSPAVCVMRTLLGLFPDMRSCSFKKSGIGEIIQACLVNLRGYFNKYFVKEIIDAEITLRRKSFYWMKIIEYCIQKHFPEMLDEYGFLIKKSINTRHRVPREIINDFLSELNTVLGLQVSPLRYYGFPKKHSGTVRCHYALPFSDGDSNEDGKKGMRKSYVQQAFNSPFWPFVLTTTSVGQEGLDFHRYCNDVVHWNLPQNPIDLEQREGRVNRFNSIVIRKNISEYYSLEKIKSHKTSQSFWENVFNYTTENADIEHLLKRGIAPNWLFSGGEKINRHVLTGKYSRENHIFDNLKDRLALYRLAFGQPRQEDLVNDIARKMDIKDIGPYLSMYMINLAPDFNHKIEKRVFRFARQYAKEPEKVSRLIDESHRKVEQERGNYPEMEGTFNKVIDNLNKVISSGSSLSGGRAVRMIAALVYLLDPFDNMCDYFPQGGFDDDIDFAKKCLNKC